MSSQLFKVLELVVLVLYVYFIWKKGINFILFQALGCLLARFE